MSLGMMLPLAILYFVLSAHVMAVYISSMDGLTYEDMLKPCYPLDTCAADVKKPDEFSDFYLPKCSCQVNCATFGTCCIDSPYRGLSPTTHKCRAVDYPNTYSGSLGFYMAQSCPENSVWKPLCEGGLDKDGDILRIAPVSSLDTNTTYKNYYCLRCNELTDNFLYWNLNLLADFDGPRPVTDIKVTYDNINNTWSAAAVEEDFFITVRLQFVVPPGVRFYMNKCKPQMVTDCPDSWKDDDVRSKCHSYMARLYEPSGPSYKNAHCALCNSKPLNELDCYAGYHISPRSFTFAHLIDVNIRDDKKEKCADDKVWEPYSKKCRKLSCAMSGYVIKDGKCVGP